jgi:hypothetical protein
VKITYIVAAVNIVGGVAILIDSPVFLQPHVLFSTTMSVLMLVLIMGLEAKTGRQREALRWFANHIRVDPKFTTEPMPEELEALVDDTSLEP